MKPNKKKRKMELYIVDEYYYAAKTIFLLYF